MKEKKEKENREEDNQEKGLTEKEIVLYVGGVQPVAFTRFSPGSREEGQAGKQSARKGRGGRGRTYVCM